MYVTAEKTPCCHDMPRKAEATFVPSRRDNSFQEFLAWASKRRLAQSDVIADEGNDRRKQEEAAARARQAMPSALVPSAAELIRSLGVTGVTVGESRENGESVAESGLASISSWMTVFPMHGGQKVLPSPKETNGTAEESESFGRMPWDIESLRAERIRFLQRVARVLATADDHLESFCMRLCPPQLGRLRLKLRVRKGAMSVRMEVETPAAGELLLEALPTLCERLTQQDIRLERFDVELMDGSLEDWRDYDSQQPDKELQRRRWHSVQQDGPLAEPETSPSQCVVVNVQGFDVIV